MESEPVRALGVAANDCAGSPVAFESSALRMWRMKPPGAVTVWNASGRHIGAGIRVLHPPPFPTLCGE
jgi:hypothetical protein